MPSNPLDPPSEPSILDRFVRWSARAEKRLARNPFARALASVPRTARFVVENIRSRKFPLVDTPPIPPLSPFMAVSVAMDETILAVAMGPGRFPRPGDWDRVAGELATAEQLYRDSGWLDAPETYHSLPPQLSDSHIHPSWTLRPGLLPLPLQFERLAFPSGWAPHTGEPGSARWESYVPNRTATAWVLRHQDDRPRPWLVCIHGFGMGFPIADFKAHRAVHVHVERGCNLIFPVLPLHGPRRITPMSGDAFLSFDLVDTVHGLAQSIWDIRRTIQWVRQTGPTAIGVHGISVGGYCAALLAGLEDDIDMVIAGVPVTDFPGLFDTHAPRQIRRKAIACGILGGPAERVHRVVSPLAFTPKVKAGSRYIYAGLGDRVAVPEQAHALWRHWDKPETLWYRGNHVAFLWSREVRELVDTTLDRHGFVA